MHINQAYQKDSISLLTNAAAVFCNKAHKYLFSKADNFSALFRSNIYVMQTSIKRLLILVSSVENITGEYARDQTESH